MMTIALLLCLALGFALRHFGPALLDKGNAWLGRKIFGDGE